MDIPTSAQYYGQTLEICSDLNTWCTKTWMCFINPIKSVIWQAMMKDLDRTDKRACFATSSIVAIEKARICMHWPKFLPHISRFRKVYDSIVLSKHI